MDLSDEELVKRCNQELPYVTLAFEALVRRYEPTVYRTCLRFLGHHHEAEEAAQDAFLRTFHGLRKFRGGSSFRTWLYRIVSNVCATRYQNMRREAERRSAYVEHVGATQETAHHDQQEVEIEGPIADALATLNIKDQQVIVLRHVTELTVPEIAEVTELSLSAAKMRLSRAEERLRTAYERLVGKKLDFAGGL